MVAAAQPQHPPPQHAPPDGPGPVPGPPTLDPVAPTEAKTDSILTAPGCPSGQVAGAFASAIGRRSSKVESHRLHLNSYSGMPRV